MSHINFVIPQNRGELLVETDGQYCVKNVIQVKEIKRKLIEAKQSLKDDGPVFIVDYFDTYYSLLQIADSLQTHVIMQAYGDLHRAMQDLNKTLGFMLEDKDSLSDEVKLKYLNVMKMLLYVYTSVVNYLETKNLVKLQNLLQNKGRKPSQRDNNDGENVDKLAVLVALNDIMQREINVFWDPPSVEEVFVSIVAEVYYKFLENPAVKHEKQVCREVFNALGTMLKSYSHGVTFVIRLVQLIKTNEHLVHCVADGIELLITNYNCKSLVRDFVREITEWQTDEKFQDSQGTRHCSIVLTEMALLMPGLMIPEVMYLNRYLAHESYTLRNSVINVITEVILAVLTKADLTEEEQESRDDFLSILEEHLYDISAHVRAKIVQHWARLQKENAIPVALQVKLLEKIVRRLRDKGALVRKNAAGCITSFLSHNPFGARLERAFVEGQLQENVEALRVLQTKLENVQPTNLRKVDEEWRKREADIRTVVENNLTAEIPEVDPKMSKQEFVELTQQYIAEEKYKEAFLLCSATSAQYDEGDRNDMGNEELVEYHVTVMRSTFFDLKSLVHELAAGVNVSEEDLRKLDTLQEAVGYFKDTVAFLKLIGDAIKPMIDLLESVSINDMHEAVSFFTAAYNFNIDDARLGLIAMLNVMKRPEQDRKDAIVNAFRTIFLVTDAKNLQDHTLTIVDRLIELLKHVPYDNVEDLRFIISDWVKNGVLDNSVVDVLWRYFTKKADVTDQQSLSAVQLLTMAATGRKTILTKNIKLVATVAFGERGVDDMLLVGAACKLLAVGGHERPNVTDKNPPFKIKPFDPIWDALIDVLSGNMKKKTPFYNQAITNAVEFIYKVCSKPDVICERFVDRLVPLLLQEDGPGDTLRMPNFVLMRCNHLLGEIAIKQLNFLDETVYKEMKRRNYVREERKNAKQGKKKPVERKYRNPTASKRLSSVDSSRASTSNYSSVIDAPDEMALEGAEADDTDAQFILNVLENETVTGSAGLAVLAPLIVKVCEDLSSYNNPYIQGASIIALLRYMTVSSKFCACHIQLVFTILERTPFSDVKCTILVHLSDLLERYPNIIEPWTPRMYDRLKDENLEVRKAAFYMLANLLLRDMVRIKGQISVMALCIVDEEDVLKDMSTNFFTQLATRGNHLYNVLPDIFSHLCDEANLTEDNFKYIMKFLFGLIDKNKQMENLVDRFCTKFSLTQDNFKCRNIAYSLSLIQYNEKGLRKLLDNFPLYKEFMQNDDVYAIFKQILNACGKSVKNEIKALAIEIEEKINSIFDVRDGEVEEATPRKKRLPPTSSKSAFKKTRGKPAKKKVKAAKTSESSSDSDY